MTREPRHIHELWVRAAVDAVPFPRYGFGDSWLSRARSMTDHTLPEHHQAPSDKEVRREYMREYMREYRGRPNKTRS